jgi:hypothetical protein
MGRWRTPHGPDTGQGVEDAVQAWPKRLPPSGARPGRSTGSGKWRRCGRSAACCGHSLPTCREHPSHLRHPVQTAGQRRAEPHAAREADSGRVVRGAEGAAAGVSEAWDTKYPDDVWDDAAMVPNPTPDPADPWWSASVAAFPGRERYTTASATVGSRRHDLGPRGHGAVAGQHQHNRKGGHVRPRTKLEVLPDQWWHPDVQGVREERIRDSVRKCKKRRTGLSI